MSFETPAKIVSDYLQAQEIQCGQVEKIDTCRKNPSDLLITLRGSFGTSPIHTIPLGDTHRVREAQQAIRKGDNVQYHVADPRLACL